MTIRSVAATAVISISAFATWLLAPGLSGGESLAQSEPTAVCLTDSATEDDYPAAAKANDGTVWLAYVEYKPGQPIYQEQVRQRRFDSLITRGNGDRIRLKRFDGSLWHPAIDVTEGGFDVWRPTVSVDGDGSLIVAWAQAVNGDWEIFCRKFTPAKGRSTTTKADTEQWSDVVRVTEEAGSDFHVVSTTDSNGTVWLAWQGWREDNFDIHVASIGENGTIQFTKVIPNTKANEWSPAITADASGNVFVAWDTYDKGDYDVRLQVIGNEPKTVTVAGSARFEARPCLACDAEGRCWIAYEEGDEQWGKDYSIPVEWGRNRGEVDPGYGLYVNRTIKVKCLHKNGKLLRPAKRLEQVFGEDFVGNKSLPRLIGDNRGGLWLLFRRHPKPGKISGGEAWNSYAVRYDGGGWSAPRTLPNSSNLIDVRPALVSLSQNVLAVYSSDTRTRTQDRKQSDLFALDLEIADEAASPEQLQLVPDESADQAKVAVVHPNETADVARMRDFRIEIGGKTLRLLRGDFHRHTEYTAHRDGDGLLEDSWRYALDAGGLDWLGNGDHDNGYGHEFHWWQIQKYTDLMHNPPGFVAVQSYERSNRFPDGHRNVIMPRRGIRPLPRGSLKGTPEEGTPDTKLLYDYLKRFGGMCASHTSGTGMGTDWRDNDPDVEPVVEIFQGCRQNYQSYEHLGAPRAAPKTPKPGRHDAGYVWNALAKGYRLGFQSSSDHFSTHISYAIVLAEDSSRGAIIDAFQKRHCYGANDNCLLIVRSGDHLMGDVFQTNQRPTLEISVHGGKPIAKLHVIRNNKYVYSTEPNKMEFDLRYTDADAEPGQSYYYVRAEQSDGNLAWASPLWIDYRP
ncbi:MAG: hypothetical protein H8E44_09660 [Planctomycetes bacterium]|nr:hypothetical protein [Planctomycetota bacterium]MBL7039073.1 hypothetical protein [Pirellulaceae bacterium]